MNTDDFLHYENIGFPQVGQKIFISDFTFGETAQVAWSKDSETQFFGYISGYKEAANDVIRSALEKGNVGTLDSYVFPAIFLYRQFLELALKDIYLAYSDDAEEDKVKKIDKCRHNLKEIWKNVKPLIDDDPHILPAVEDYIFEFADFDSGSYAYRYPLDMKLNLYHEKPKLINLRNLAERINELAWYLECVGTGLEVRRNDIHEMRYCGII